MSKPEPKVFVLIPVFNRLNFTKKCLNSLAKQDYKNIEVIVIDSGSTDGTREYIREKQPKVKLIPGDNSWWWTRCMVEGVDMAMKKAKANDYILEMNNDCYFDSGYIRQLIQTHKKYPKSVIGSLCIRHDNTTVVEAGIRIDWKTGVVYGVAPTVSSSLQYFQKMEVIRDLDALPGKGTLIPVAVFKMIGNFNHKRLPHYIADYEFANRAKRHGFELLVDTHAVVRHYWEATGMRVSSLESSFGYKKAWQIMFGRKSMNNLVDWLNFLWLACPRNLLALNLYNTFWRTVYGATSLFPLTIFRPIVPLIPKTIAAIYRLPRTIRKQL